MTGSERGPRGRARTVVATLLLTLATTLPAWAQEPGGPAPDFTLVTADGAPVTLADLRGRPIVLNFWASWCAPCRNELPLFAAAARAPADADGGSAPPLFVLINLDDAPAAGRAFLDEVLGDVPEAMLPVYTPARERRAELRAAGRDALTAEAVARRYRVLGYPTTVVVDAAGTVVAVRPGELRRDDLRALLAAVGVVLP